MRGRIPGRPTRTDFANTRELLLCLKKHRTSGEGSEAGVVVTKILRGANSNSKSVKTRLAPLVEDGAVKQYDNGRYDITPKGIKLIKSLEELEKEYPSLFQ